MSTAWFDTSAIVKLLIDEPGSDVAARVWDDIEVVATSRLAMPEVRSALSAARRAGRIDAGGLSRARAQWARFATDPQIVELTAEIAEAAGTLADELVLSGADAVHLASALSIGDRDPLLVTWDREMRDAGARLGLTVVPAP